VTCVRRQRVKKGTSGSRGVGEVLTSPKGGKKRRERVSGGEKKNRVLEVSSRRGRGDSEKLKETNSGFSWRGGGEITKEKTRDKTGLSVSWQRPANDKRLEKTEKGPGKGKKGPER